MNRKLVSVVVAALAVFGLAVSSTAAVAGSDVVASPCCKTKP